MKFTCPHCGKTTEIQHKRKFSGYTDDELSRMAKILKDTLSKLIPLKSNNNNNKKNDPTL